MSSRLNIKPSKKERPRSSDRINKKRPGGTPDKPTTPSASQDGADDDMLDRKKAIINDEILALQIKDDELAKFHPPRPPGERKKSPTTSTRVVRKMKPASEWDHPPVKTITVAKPAPPEAKVKPVDYSDAGGVRLDERGQIIPHSILGSVDDYRREASRCGDLPPDADVEERPPTSQLTVKYEKEKSSASFPKYASVDESNALLNWQKRMRERRQQQGYLSKLLDKPVEQLVMNQADDYRQTQELRYLIDRTIPTMDYGKGYRIGSEFWKQQERIGDDLAGMHMTLSQTEKGYPPPIEHVGVPLAVMAEKGRNWGVPQTPFHKPWHKTPYLKQRRQQLEPVMRELDPHDPALEGLEVVGMCGDNLLEAQRWKQQSEEESLRQEHQQSALEEAMSEQHLQQLQQQVDDMREHRLQQEQDEPELSDSQKDELAERALSIQEPAFGPSLLIAGQAARWTGDSNSFRDQLGLEARVSFETYASRRTTSYLELTNDGTTALYYDWKKVPKTNPFDVVNAKVQRFYFNTSSGVILPGDSMKLPFVFKSPNAGVFSEQWQLETHPVVCGGATLLISLRGVALQEDKYSQQRSQLEQELAHKQAEQVVEGVLNDLLEGIRSPDRSASPVDAYITEDEIFARKNPQLKYQRELVENLKQLYLQLFPEEDREGQEWDLDVQTLEQIIMCREEDEEHQEEKQELLQQLNQTVITLSFPPFTPKQQRMYTAGYALLSELVDKVVSDGVNLRAALGLPEPKSSGIPEDTSDGKRGGQSQKGKADQKDKKSGKESKTSAKSPSKEAKGGGTKGAASGKRPTTRDKDREPSPRSEQGSPTLLGDPLMAAKYSHKFYTQAYQDVSAMLDHMGSVFDDIQTDEGGPRLPTLS